MQRYDATGGTQVFVKLLAVLSLLFIFLLGVSGLGASFKLLGRDLLDSFFAATENPFIALMVGILGTTLVQSSSVSTAIIVGLVAAPENPLPIANAIPMIMGTNIGTTVTNTAVSLVHIGRRGEFGRAFAVATCHDFFNFITVAVLLPLELMTGYLQSTAMTLAALLSGVGGVKFKSPLKAAIKAGVEPLIAAGKSLSDSNQIQGAIVAILSVALIFVALFLLVKVMRSAMQTRIEVYITRFLGHSAMLSLLVGMIMTVMVQSSSITTSLLVPLAGAGLITLEQAFPITLGANIGTTVTALLASMAVSGGNASMGVAIALVHLLFNLTGTVMVYPLRATRRIPLMLARRFAEFAVRSRRWAILYILIMFYALPAAFAFLNRWLQ